jgi:hypothetical protein
LKDLDRQNKEMKSKVAKGKEEMERLRRQTIDANTKNR